MHFSSCLPRALAMIPEPLKTLWHEATFANLFRALPTVFTSSLFMVFRLLELALACLKWLEFLVIITFAFMLGFVLLVVAVGLLVGGVTGLVMEAVGVEEREGAVPESDTEGEGEQVLRRLVPSRTNSDLVEDEEGIEQEAEKTAVAREVEEHLFNNEELRAKEDPELRALDDKAAIQRQGEEGKETMIGAVKRRARLPEGSSPN